MEILTPAPQEPKIHRHGTCGVRQTTERGSRSDPRSGGKEMPSTSTPPSGSRPQPRGTRRGCLRRTPFRRVAQRGGRWWFAQIRPIRCSICAWLKRAWPRGSADSAGPRHPPSADPRRAIAAIETREGPTSSAPSRGSFPDLPERWIHAFGLFRDDALLQPGAVRMDGLRHFAEPGAAKEVGGVQPIAGRRVEEA